MAIDHTRPDQETREAAEGEAVAAHRADREPTEEEERAAEQNELDPEVARRYEEAGRRGAELKGEGSIP